METIQQLDQAILQFAGLGLVERVAGERRGGNTAANELAQHRGDGAGPESSRAQSREVVLHPGGIGRTDSLFDHVAHDLVLPLAVGVHHQLGVEPRVEGVGHQQTSAKGVNRLNRELIESAKQDSCSPADLWQSSGGEDREIDPGRF